VAENNDKNKNKAKLEELQASLDQKRIELDIAMADGVKEFLSFDTQFNKVLLEISKTVSDVLQRNPSALFRSSDAGTNLDELLKEMKKREGSSSGSGIPGVTGSDIVGADWIDDVARFIQAIGITVKDEKEFWFKVVRLFKCGCGG
jgi:hypothetical protein